MATAMVAEQVVAVWTKYLTSPTVVITALKAANLTEKLGRLMTVTGPETGLGAAAIMTPGAWCLVVSAGVGVVLVYVAYRTGQILFRLNAISENDCGGGGQRLATATDEEQLRDQLETIRTTANNNAKILQVPLDAERRTVQMIVAERDQLGNRLLTFENDNRIQKADIVEMKKENKTLTERNKTLVKENEDLKKENKTVVKKVETLTNEVRDLKKENADQGKKIDEQGKKIDEQGKKIDELLDLMRERWPVQETNARKQD